MKGYVAEVDREVNMRCQRSWIRGAAICPPISEHKQVPCSPNQQILQLTLVPGSMLDAEGVEKEQNISPIS